MIRYEFVVEASVVLNLLLSSNIYTQLSYECFVSFQESPQKSFVVFNYFSSELHSRGIF